MKREQTLAVVAVYVVLRSVSLCCSTAVVSAQWLDCVADWFERL